MPPHALKAGVFAATSLTTVATFYHLSYLFFLLRDRFGFDNRANLSVAALHGGIYIIAAWQGGRFAERHGNVASLTIGFGGLALSMGTGALVSSAAGLMVLVAAYSVALLFIWPALEAMAIADEPPERVPHVVGLYNLTWSGSAALAYFTGGPLYDWLGAWMVFVIPAAISAFELVALLILTRGANVTPVPRVVAVSIEPPVAAAIGDRTPRPRGPTFLRLAWLANPLAYMAIYTLLAVMPGLAAALGLSPTEVGLFCSIWFFARLVSFAVLWRWTAWHYRFRFLAGAYILLMASFLAMLLAGNLAVLVIGQVVFGAAAGVAYYSSLFYSMDLSDTKAEHGGLHEAGVGLGIFAGPAVGALSLHLLPASSSAGAFAVTGLLACGLAAMFAIWRRG